MAGYLGGTEYVELTLNATLKGGSPPAPAPDGRQLPIRFRVLVQPFARPPGEPMPAGVRLSSEEDPAALPGGADGGKKGAVKKGGKT